MGTESAFQSAPLSTAARAFFGIAIVAFGVLHLVHGSFVTRVVPHIAALDGGQPLWAYALGLLLVVAGAAILTGAGSRAASLLLAVLLMLSFLALYLPALVSSPPLGGLWTQAGKALALAGGAMLVAASLRRDPGVHSAFGLAAFGRTLLAAFFILAGVQHFLFANFVATLVPAWIPGHVFWTYFAGVALIAAGLGMHVRRVAHVAALASGLMTLSWVFLLHIPRALVDLRSANETTAVFEALAMSGAALLVASWSRARAVRGI